MIVFLPTFTSSASSPHLNTWFILWGNRRVSAVEHKSNQWFNKNLCPLNEVGVRHISTFLRPALKMALLLEEWRRVDVRHRQHKNNYTKLIERWGKKLGWGGRGCMICLSIPVCMPPGGTNVSFEQFVDSPLSSWPASIQTGSIFWTLGTPLVSRGHQCVIQMPRLHSHRLRLCTRISGLQFCTRTLTISASIQFSTKYFF